MERLQLLDSTTKVLPLLELEKEKQVLSHFLVEGNEPAIYIYIYIFMHFWC